MSNSAVKRGRRQITHDLLRVTAVRLTHEHQVLFRRLGGSAWLREQLNDIKTKKDQNGKEETSV